MNDKVEDRTTASAPGIGKQNWFKRLFAGISPENKATALAVLVGSLGVVLSMLLRIIEAQIAGKLIPPVDGPVPNFAAFLFNEYAAVGTDLIAVAFSLLVGGWIAARDNVAKAAKISGPIIVLLVLALATIVVKGFADGVVDRHEKLLTATVSSPILKFTTIEQKCATAPRPSASVATVSSSPPETVEACDGLREAKRYQIFLPVVLGAVTIFVAAVGLSRP